MRVVTVEEHFDIRALFERISPEALVGRALFLPRIR